MLYPMQYFKNLFMETITAQRVVPIAYWTTVKVYLQGDSSS
jgi:hypothetical protein